MSTLDRMAPFLSRLSSSLLLMFLAGCSQPRSVRKPYPLWGEEIVLNFGKERSRHLQIKIPGGNHPTEACIMIVHGMNEYIGRYAQIADYFADRYIVAGVDLTAHGLSNRVFAQAQKRLDAGVDSVDVSDAFLEQAQIRDLQPLRDDLEQALLYLMQRCTRQPDGKKLPVFILSHSLGSLVSASYLLQTQHSILKNRIGGIIFTGPAFSVTQVPDWRGWFQNPLVRFSYHEHFLNPHNEALPLLLFNQILALLAVPLQDALIEFLSLPGMRQVSSPTTPDWVTEYLSNWEEQRKRQRADPYIIRRSILRYVLAVEKAVIQFRGTMADFNTPYLLIYSEHDPITPAWGSCDFAAATLGNHPHNQVMMLAGENHHEHLFSTPDLTRELLHKIDAWLQLRIEYP